MNMNLNKELQNAVKYLKDKVNKGSYLVTGATGNIASYIIKILLNIDGVKVIAVCHNYQKGIATFEEYANQRLLIMEKDITEPLDDVYGNVDYIIHAGAICQNRICERYPQEVINVNVLGTYNLLEFAKKKRVQKFCFFSSAAVYGNMKSDLCAESEFGEIDFTNPQNAYGLSKRIAENLCAIYKSSFSILIVRPFHIIEPHTLFDKDLMLGYFYDRVKTGQEIILNTDGSPKRNFTWIIDAVSVILEIMAHKSGTYNIGNPKGTLSVREIAEIIMKIGEKQHAIIYKKKEFQKPSNLWDMVPDLEREIDVIGDKEFLGIEEAIRICEQGI